MGPSLFQVLANLDIQTIKNILCKSRKSRPTVIDAAELKQRYGFMVTRKHQVALNRLTLLAHDGPLQAESGPDPMTHNSSASLPVEMRQVDVTLIEADLERHKRSDSTSYEGDWQPDSSQTATQLISRALRTAFGRPAPAEKITLNMTGSCWRKSKTKHRLTYTCTDHGKSLKRMTLSLHPIRLPLRGADRPKLQCAGPLHLANIWRTVMIWRHSWRNLHIRNPWTWTAPKKLT